MKPNSSLKTSFKQRFGLCCAGGREPLQQPPAAPGALRQVARKRPGGHEDPHQGEQEMEREVEAQVQIMESESQ